MSTRQQLLAGIAQELNRIEQERVTLENKRRDALKAKRERERIASVEKPERTLEEVLSDIRQTLSTLPKAKPAPPADIVLSREQLISGLAKHLEGHSNG